MQLEIDQILVNDQLIEVSYVVPQPWSRQTVFFKTSEFEDWLKDQRAVDLNRYWDHWHNQSTSTLEDKLIQRDLECYFFKKLNVDYLDKSEQQARQITELKDQLKLLQKKPMKRATGKKSSGSGRSKTA